jgi:Domain of unknown function (DUF4136)
MNGWSRLGLAVGLCAVLWFVPVHADEHFVDYDTSVDFSTFKTFALGTGTMNSDAPELDNAITRKGIADTIRAMLVKRKLVEGPTPDLVVNWSMGAAPGRGSRAVTPGRPRREPFTYTKGTFVIEMTTHQTHLVWHGTYRDDEDNPAKIAERLPKNIAKLLGEFPPRK